LTEEASNLENDNEWEREQYFHAMIQYVVLWTCICSHFLSNGVITFATKTFYFSWLLWDCLVKISLKIRQR